MERTDARSLSQEAKAALRKRGVVAVRSGMKQKDVAQALGVSAYAVNLWMKTYRTQGENGLAARKKGPAKGFGKKLMARQEQQVCRWVRGKHPEQLRLPFALWTRDAVRELVEAEFGITLGASTVGNYLKAWGFTPQKPVRRAFEQSSAAVKTWLHATYPAIHARAKAEGAEIYWADEMGLRSDHQAGRSWSPRGRTPVIPGTGQRFSTNMISAITNRGHMCFMVFNENFRVKVFTVFLRRLIKQARRKVFVIVDGHPVHRAKLIQAWRAKHADDLEIFYLPGYSPELNPDEMLNNDAKGNTLGRKRPKDKPEMVSDLRAYLHSTQKRPDIVRSFFHERHVRYAA
jgi:transposase